MILKTSVINIWRTKQQQQNRNNFNILYELKYGYKKRTRKYNIKKLTIFKQSFQKQLIYKYLINNYIKEHQKKKHKKQINRIQNKNQACFDIVEDEDEEIQNKNQTCFDIIEHEDEEIEKINQQKYKYNYHYLLLTPTTFLKYKNTKIKNKISMQYKKMKKQKNKKHENKNKKYNSQKIDPRYMENKNQNRNFYYGVAGTCKTYNLFKDLSKYKNVLYICNTNYGLEFKLSQEKQQLRKDKVVIQHERRLDIIYQTKQQFMKQIFEIKNDDSKQLYQAIQEYIFKESYKGKHLEISLISQMYKKLNSLQIENMSQIEIEDMLLEEYEIQEDQQEKYQLSAEIAYYILLDVQQNLYKLKDQQLIQLLNNFDNKKYINNLQRYKYYDIKMKQNIERNIDSIIIDEIQQFSEIEIQLLCRFLKDNKQIDFSIGGDIYQQLQDNDNVQSKFKHIEKIAQIHYLDRCFRFGKEMCELLTQISKINHIPAIEQKTQIILNKEQKIDMKQILEIIIPQLKQENNGNIAIIIENKELKDLFLQKKLIDLGIHLFYNIKIKYEEKDKEQQEYWKKNQNNKLNKIIITDIYHSLGQSYDNVITIDYQDQKMKYIAFSRAIKNLMVFENIIVEY